MRHLTFCTLDSHYYTHFIMNNAFNMQCTRKKHFIYAYELFNVWNIWSHLLCHVYECTSTLSCIWGCWNTLNMKNFLEAKMFCSVQLTEFQKSILQILLYLFLVAYFLIIIISAGQWLIVINRIQNKSFCLYNICMCTVYIYYVAYI